MRRASSADQPSFPRLQPVTVHVEHDIATAVAVAVAVALPVASRRMARHVILRPGVAIDGAAIAATAVTFNRADYTEVVRVAASLKAAAVRFKRGRLP